MEYLEMGPELIPFLSEAVKQLVAKSYDLPPERKELAGGSMCAPTSELRAPA